MSPFMALVNDMRQAQREYRVFPSATNLQKMRTYEQIVDKEIEDALITDTWAVVGKLSRYPDQEEEKDF